MPILVQNRLEVSCNLQTVQPAPLEEFWDLLEGWYNERIFFFCFFNSLHVINDCELQTKVQEFFQNNNSKHDVCISSHLTFILE